MKAPVLNTYLLKSEKIYILPGTVNIPLSDVSNEHVTKKEKENNLMFKPPERQVGRKAKVDVNYELPPELLPTPIEMTVLKPDVPEFKPKFMNIDPINVEENQIKPTEFDSDQAYDVPGPMNIQVSQNFEDQAQNFQDQTQNFQDQAQNFQDQVQNFQDQAQNFEDQAQNFGVFKTDVPDFMPREIFINDLKVVNEMENCIEWSNETYPTSDAYNIEYMSEIGSFDVNLPRASFNYLENGFTSSWTSTSVTTKTLPRQERRKVTVTITPEMKNNSSQTDLVTYKSVSIESKTETCDQATQTKKFNVYDLLKSCEVSSQTESNNGILVLTNQNKQTNSECSEITRIAYTKHENGVSTSMFQETRSSSNCCQSQNRMPSLSSLFGFNYNDKNKEIAELKKSLEYERKVFNECLEVYKENVEAPRKRVEELESEIKELKKELSELKEKKSNNHEEIFRKMLIDQINNCRNFFAAYLQMFEQKCSRSLWELEDIKRFLSPDSVPSLGELNANMQVWKNSLNEVVRCKSFILNFYNEAIYKVQHEQIDKVVIINPLASLFLEPANFSSRYFSTILALYRKMEGDLNRHMATFYQMVNPPPGLHSQYPYANGTNLQYQQRNNFISAPHLQTSIVPAQRLQNPCINNYQGPSLVIKEQTITAHLHQNKNISSMADSSNKNNSNANKMKAVLEEKEASSLNVTTISSIDENKDLNIKINSLKSQALNNSCEGGSNKSVLPIEENQNIDTSDTNNDSEDQNLNDSLENLSCPISSETQKTQKTVVNVTVLAQNEVYDSSTFERENKDSTSALTLIKTKTNYDNLDTQNSQNVKSVKESIEKVPPLGEMLSSTKENDPIIEISNKTYSTGAIPKRTENGKPLKSKLQSTCEEAEQLLKKTQSTSKIPDKCQQEKHELNGAGVSNTASNIKGLVISDKPLPSVGVNVLLEKMRKWFPNDSAELQREAVARVRRRRGGLSGLTGSQARADLVDALRELRRNNQSETKPRQTAWGKVDNNPFQWQSDEYDNNCIICFDPLDIARTRKLKCLHLFHELCIKTWLSTESICPICRVFTTLDDDYPPLK